MNRSQKIIDEALPALQRRSDMIAAGMDVNARRAGTVPNYNLHDFYGGAKGPGSGNFILRGQHARTGTEHFYTGKAGSDFVTLATERNRSQAFRMGEGEAQNKAANLNRMSQIHGLHFKPEPA